MDDYEKMMRESERAAEAERHEQFVRARRDMCLMLEGQAPQEGEDYGFWKPHLTQLLQAFERTGALGVQYQLVIMVNAGQLQEMPRLVRGAVASDGRSWLEVLKGVEATLRREVAEIRMRERLARTTGDSMADEIMAMLRERELARTDIYRRYSRNVTAERINDALFVLERLGWARWKTVSTGGRKREVWYLPPDEEA